MGNSQQSKHDLATIQPQYFNADNLWPVILPVHGISNVSILYLDELKRIIISTIDDLHHVTSKNDVHEFGVYTLTNKVIAKSSKNKSKLSFISPLLKIPIWGSKYDAAIASALIYNSKLNSVLTSCAVNHQVTIFKIDISNESYSIFCGFSVHRSIISFLKLMNDNSHRIIVGTHDGCLHIYDYNSEKELFHLKMADGDIGEIDYYHNSNSELIICCCSINNGFISISTINDIDIQNMKNTNLIKLKISNYGINCISFSPNNNSKYIICGDENGICTILIKDNNNINKYNIEIKETVFHNNYKAITSMCWLNSNTFICGSKWGRDCHLEIIYLDIMNKNNPCTPIIAEYVNGIDYIAQIILDFCGIYIDRHSIKIQGGYNGISSICSLTNYKVAPSIFVTGSPSSGGNRGCSALHIPMINYKKT